MTHIATQKGKLPGKIYAVVMKSRTLEEGDRLKTYIYTYDSKTAANSHFESAKRNFPDEEVIFREGEIVWKDLK